MAPHIRQWFIWSSAWVLAITGCAKLISAFGDAAALDATDPVLDLPFRYLLMSAGQIELTVSFLCVTRSRRNQALLAVAWVATNCAIYRLGLTLLHWHRPCGCLGNLTEVLHISPILADKAMKVVLVYLVVGSYGSLLWPQARRLWPKGCAVLCARSV